MQWQLEISFASKGRLAPPRNPRTMVPMERQINNQQAASSQPRACSSEASQPPNQALRRVRGTLAPKLPAETLYSVLEQCGVAGRGKDRAQPNRWGRGAKTPHLAVKRLL
jgi:hypothetical protein